MSTCRPGTTMRRSSSSPSRLILTSAGVARTPSSSTLNEIVCDWPTMPKRGAAMRTTRRSRSLAVPVMRAWTGAAKPSAPTSAGTSWTRPSVMKTAPATRSGGTSASVALRAENRRVPSVSPSAWPASTTRISMPGMRCRRWVIAARAASVCAARSPKFWLGLLSTTTTATEDSGSRSSRVSDGLARARTSSARAPVRISAPRLRDTSSSAAMAAASAAAAHTYSTGMKGEKLIPKFTRAAPVLPCSLPSPAPQVFPAPREEASSLPAPASAYRHHCPSRSSRAGTWT